jgi:hypothetical protein
MAVSARRGPTAWLDTLPTQTPEQLLRQLRCKTHLGAQHLLQYLFYDLALAVGPQALAQHSKPVLSQVLVPNGTPAGPPADGGAYMGP